VGAFASAAANCWLAASSAFNVPAPLLYAVAEVETGFNPYAIEHPKNGTRSVGVMQINSIWFPTLQRIGVSEQMLYDPCVNIHVGAWILSMEIARYGYSWEAVGAYNAGPYDARSHGWKVRYYRTYAEKVLGAWHRLNRRSGLEPGAR
jgi:soluble lytic murein transglycosylase-like protein